MRREKIRMHYIFSGLFSYGIGFLGYTITLKMVWDQTLGGDMNAVLFWGAVAYFLVAFPIHLLTVAVVEKLFTRPKLFYYPLGCMLVFFVPTLFITSSLSGQFILFTPEAMLFHAFFLLAGLTFGLMTGFFKRAKFQHR